MMYHRQHNLSTSKGVKQLFTHSRLARKLWLTRDASRSALNLQLIPLMSRMQAVSSPASALWPCEPCPARERTPAPAGLPRIAKLRLQLCFLHGGPPSSSLMSVACSDQPRSQISEQQGKSPWHFS